MYLRIAKLLPARLENAIAEATHQVRVLELPHVSVHELHKRLFGFAHRLQRWSRERGGGGGGDEIIPSLTRRQ